MKITPKQLAQTLFDLTDGKTKAEADKVVADFAGYIYRNRKMKIVGKIIDQFSALYNAKKGIVEAEVVTSEKIPEGIAKKVKDFVRNKYFAKEVVLKNTVDEKLKGGIVVKVGDEVMDGSVKRQLTNLHRLLTE